MSAVRLATRPSVRVAAALLALATLLVAPQGRAAGKDAPSRPPVPRCQWEEIANAAVGLQAWVQRCDFGFRKIDFLFQGNALAIRYSDGGAPDPLIEVLDLLPGESSMAGIKRLFSARTDPALGARCVMVPYRGDKPPVGARRFTFVPNAAYRKELKAKSNPNEIGDPPCGEWGAAPDGIQYFEAHAAGKARHVLFVRVGQDEPLFDEKSLRLLEPSRP